MSIQLLLRDITANYRALSADEERATHVLAKTGDRRARDKLVHSVMPMAVGMARRYCPRMRDLEDMIQYASLGVIRAVDTFDPDKGRLTTHTHFRVREKIIEFLSTQQSVIRVPRLSNKLHRDRYGKAAELARVVLSLRPAQIDCKSQNRGGREPDEVWRLRKAIALLPPQRRQAIQGKLAGKSVAQIADDMGITRDAVQRYVRVALADISEMLCGDRQELTAEGVFGRGAA